MRTDSTDLLRRFGRAALGAGLALGMIAITPAPSSAREPRPNVLFIIADDLNLSLGAYGRSHMVTPNIDALAARGVLFEQAYSQFPLCAPSRASLMTGRRPATTGVRDLRTHIRANLPDVVTLPQHFRAQGYFAGRVGKIFHQNVPAGIGTDGLDDPASWDEAVNPSGRDKAAEAGALINLTPPMGYGTALAYLADGGEDEEQTDGMVASETIRMITQNRDRPFFIAAGFYRPHVPEVAPARYFDLYPIDQVGITRETQAHLDSLLTASLHWLPAYLGVNAEQHRDFVRSYYAATSFVDAQVGRILSALDDLDLGRNTVVVVTSDHGFMLGEHGQWEKNVLWDTSTHVPLIIYSPQAGGNGRRVAGLVELIDLFPTLVELAGAEQAEGLEGRSLVPLLSEPDLDWGHPAFSEVLGGRSVRWDRWRYTLWSDGVLGAELYDLHSDPLERRNLAGDPAHAGLERRLAAMLPDQQGEGRPPLLRLDREAGVIQWLPMPPTR